MMQNTAGCGIWKNRIRTVLFTMVLCAVCFAGSVCAADVPSALPESAPESGELNTDTFYQAFPDAAFRNAVVSELEQTVTEETLLEDVRTALAAITKLDVSSSSIYALDGIQYLTGLEELDCSNNSLTELLLDGMTALEVLDCNNNQLTSLTLTGCTNLTELVCSDNQLTTLSLTGSPDLWSLDCSCNQLTKLAVLKKNAAQPAADVTAVYASNMEVLNCSENRLTELIIGVPLTNLSCSRNTDLTDLQLNTSETARKQLAVLDITGTPQPDLDISGYTALTSLSLAETGRTALDLTKYPLLEYCDCSANEITELDLSQCTLLEDLECYTNRMTALNVNSCTKLRILDCSKNALTTLTMDACAKMEQLYCVGNHLRELKVHTNISVKTEYSDLTGQTFDVSDQYISRVGTSWQIDIAKMVTDGVIQSKNTEGLPDTVALTSDGKFSYYYKVNNALKLEIVLQVPQAAALKVNSETGTITFTYTNRSGAGTAYCFACAEYNALGQMVGITLFPVTLETGASYTTDILPKKDTSTLKVFAIVPDSFLSMNGLYWSLNL